MLLGEFSESEPQLRVPMERTLLLVQLKVHTACLCSGLLLYEKPLAEIDKMLELIKNTDKDTREYFSSNKWRENISSHSSTIYSQSAFFRKPAS